MRFKRKTVRTAALLLASALLAVGLLTGCGGSDGGSSGGSAGGSNNSADITPTPDPDPWPDPDPDPEPWPDPTPSGPVTLPDQMGVYWIVEPTSETTGTLVGYDSSKNALPQSLTFPSKLGDYTITAIGRIDYGDAKVVELTVPASVTQIANWAFASVNGLQKLTILGPAQLGKYMCYYSSDLTEVHLNDGITDIPEQAFAMCKNLHDFKFPSQLKTIGDQAFYDADWAFYVEHVYDENTGWDNSYTKTKLPDGLTEIGESAFESCWIDYIEIPAGVKKIGKNAFLETGLRYVEVLDGVEELDEGAFYNCELKDVYLPRSITSIGAKAFWRSISWNFRIHYAGSETDWQKISIAADNDDLREAVLQYNADRSAFEELPSGQQAGEVLWRYRHDYEGGGMELVGYDEKGAVPSGDVVFPAYIDTANGRTPVTAIGSITRSMSNFEQCTGITSVTVPDTVTTIGQSAFENCKWLTTIYLSKNLKTIESEAFQGCTALRSVTLPDSLKTIGYEAFWNCTDLRSADLPEGLTSIGYQAFYNARLSEVIVSASVTEIGAGAFDNNQYLTRAEIKGTPKMGESQWTGIFDGCSKLAEVKLNRAITEIPNRMFSGCRALTKITLPTQLKRIGENAFYSTGIKELRLPDTVTEIGEEAFEYSSLEKIVLSKGMKSIPVNEFHSASRLQAVYIPESVTLIDLSAFEGCGYLANETTIYYGGSDWSRVKIEASGNEKLTDGTITVHCNASPSDVGLTETVSLLSLFGL